MLTNDPILAVTYSSANGLCFYVNGQLAGWSALPTVELTPGNGDLYFGSQITSKFYDHEIPRDKINREQGPGARS